MAIKVLIIDDSALVRETLSQILNSDTDIKVIATASDPIFGVKKIKIERPDVIILDIEMGGGLTAWIWQRKSGLKISSFLSCLSPDMMSICSMDMMCRRFTT